ncbi:MAG: hypothetical protein ACI4NP_02635 [Thermoguttaceae bacterium]
MGDRNPFFDLPNDSTSKVLDVLRVEYELHYSRAGNDKPPTLQVTYYHEGRKTSREWLCPEHKGFARDKFVEWWKWKSVVVPPTDAETAERYAKAGALATPKKIKVSTTPGRNFPTIEWVDFSPIPKFKPIDAIQKEDWNVDKQDREGFEEFARFDDPTSAKRCGQCKSWMPSLVMNEGELESGGFCLEYEQRTPFYECACNKFSSNDDASTDIPF